MSFESVQDVLKAQATKGISDEVTTGTSWLTASAVTML
jgi:hypothetical protein